MSLKYNNIILYNKDGIIITEYSYINMSFLDNLEYEDDTICFTADKIKLAIKSKIKYIKDDGTIDINKIKNNELINTLLTIADLNKRTYLEGVKENNIIKATIFCDKRDLTKMFYKLLINNDFSYTQLYKYAINSYSRIEDSYGYDILAKGMEYCINNDSKIKDNILNSLKDKTDKNGNIIAYRGVNNKNRKDDGISYTLDRKIAENFSKRWNSEGIINTYKINIDDIIAFIDNGEKEIISKKAKLI